MLLTPEESIQIQVGAFFYAVLLLCDFFNIHLKFLLYLAPLILIFVWFMATNMCFQDPIIYDGILC